MFNSKQLLTVWDNNKGKWVLKQPERPGYGIGIPSGKQLNELLYPTENQIEHIDTEVTFKSIFAMLMSKGWGAIRHKLALSVLIGITLTYFFDAFTIFTDDNEFKESGLGANILYWGSGLSIFVLGLGLAYAIISYLQERKEVKNSLRINLPCAQREIAIKREALEFFSILIPAEFLDEKLGEVEEPEVEINLFMLNLEEIFFINLKNLMI